MCTVINNEDRKNTKQEKMLKCTQFSNIQRAIRKISVLKYCSSGL